MLVFISNHDKIAGLTSMHFDDPALYQLGHTAPTLLT